MIAAVVLAAGASSRLGRPKQLLPYRGHTLIRHVVECASQGGCDPVLVVLGAQASAVRGEIDGSVARPLCNERWREGLGSSVRAGVEVLQADWPDVIAALLLTSDQPRITPDLVRRILESFETSGHPIVACEYADTVGVPALFDRSLFPELLSLEGDAGAKRIIQAHAAEVVSIPWPDGAFDVDTPRDADRDRRCRSATEGNEAPSAEG